VQKAFVIMGPKTCFWLNPEEFLAVIRRRGG